MSRKIVRSTWLLIFGLAVLGCVAAGQEAQAPALDAVKKQAIVEEVASLLNREYIFAGTAKKMEEALRAQLMNGSLDLAADAAAFARAINPYSKTNWEGTGVTPDIAVPATEAFDRAYAAGLLRRIMAVAPAFGAKLEARWKQSFKSADRLREIPAELSF